MKPRRAADIAQEAYRCGDRGDVRLAIRLLGQAIELAPRVEYLNERSLYHSTLGNFEDAVEDLTRAISLDSGDVDLFVNRANARIRSGNLTSAASDLEQAIRIDETCKWAWNSAGSISIKQGSLPKAIKQLTRSTEIDPNYGSAHFNLALAYHKAGNTEAAKRAITKAIRIMPEDEETRRLASDINST